MPKPKNPRGITSIFRTEFQAWLDMKKRCYGATNPRYKDYGGRGIRVCHRWYFSFKNFLDDMGPKPSTKHSLDRIDNNSDYHPSNCRWATYTQQLRNQRNTKFLTLNGETLPIIEWAERLGVTSVCIINRLRRGWPVEKTLTSKSWEGIHHGSMTTTINGKTLSIRQWAIKLGFRNINIIYDRLKLGWTIERALTTPARKYSMLNKGRKS